MIMLLISNYNIVRIKIIDTDISFFPFNIPVSSKFLLYLECYLLLPKMHKKVSKQIKQSKKYVSITKKSGTSITVIYHAMSLTTVCTSKKYHSNEFKCRGRGFIFLCVNIFFFAYTEKRDFCKCESGTFCTRRLLCYIIYFVLVSN